MRATMYQIRNRDMMDRAVFMFTFLAGVIGTIILKLDFVNADAVILAAYPVLVLSGYGIYCWFNRASTMEPETAGDNCYYLGFLFTLASLAVTLYRVNSAGSGSEAGEFDIAEVISGFGIALASTIAGVLLRVLFFQMRPDLVAADRQARTELSQGVKEFRQQLSVISRELKGVSAEFAQHVSERNSKLLEVIESQQSQSDSDLRKRLDAIADAFANMPSELSEKFSAGIRGGVENATSNVATAINELKTALEGLSTMQETGATAVENSSIALKQSMTQFEGAVDAFKTKIDASATSMSEVSEKLHENQERIDEIVTKLDRRVLEVAENARPVWWFRRGRK